ncbi:hypothetical protein Igag_1199 [Ignisphaera aggregans DSM 17230]|uniref:Uncharacterized protein n=1 Tax=Ignisphaera aggregans (strain DSM 17230 / JCM 13409 / AQ1.S1) TaxID=583356 RepID=E0SP78_IGNAA|nr:hypothetical protein Igag_1199 [Ignisphaera aggregans DSM 17230]
MFKHGMPYNPCPRCKNELQLSIEVEKKQKMATISYTYICPVCKYKDVNEYIELQLNGNKVLVRRIRLKTDSQKKLPQ